MPAGLFHFASKCLFDDLFLTLEILGKIILQSAWKMEDGFSRNLGSRNKLGRAGPADFNATKELGF
jgi:hypothetical protein